MGQAKNRGTKDERTAMAIERDEEAERKRQAMIADRWRKLTPEQKARQLEEAKMLAIFLALGHSRYRY